MLNLPKFGLRLTVIMSYDSLSFVIVHKQIIHNGESYIHWRFASEHYSIPYQTLRRAMGRTGEHATLKTLEIPSSRRHFGFSSLLYVLESDVVDMAETKKHRKMFSPPKKRFMVGNTISWYSHRNDIHSGVIMALIHIGESAIEKCNSFKIGLKIYNRITDISYKTARYLVRCEKDSNYSYRIVEVGRARSEITIDGREIY